MKVGDWMNRRVVTCRALDDLSKIARQMWDSDLGSLPVVDGNDRILGIITDRDLCMGAYIKGRSLADLVASGCMQQEVHTCRPEDGIDHALALMAERQIRRLPVVSADDRVVGIFTLGDAARASAGVKATRARRLLSEAVSLALAAITTPRFQPRADEKVVEIEPTPSKKVAAAHEKGSRSSAKKR